MTNIKSTKHALLSSVLALFLCFAMLLGTTFAWFTDSVTSANNIIKTGNLDIELEYAKVVGGSITDWATVQGANEIFDPNALWEPGRVEVVYLKVSNLGTLALKYQLGVNVVNESVGKNGAGEDIKLSDHLVFKVVEMPDTLTTYTDREAVATAAGTEKGLKDYNSDTTALEVGGTDYVALIVYMPESVGNEANYRGDDIPTITLGVNLYATQQMSEKDSFGDNYDEYAGLPWDGSVGDVPAAVENVITITTAAELAAFAADVNSGNSYSGKTVKLAADLDLAGKAWTSIGDCESGKYFQGTFDGQGYTISNLYVDYSTDASEHATAGLFGWVDAAMATVKNVNVDGATVKGSHWVGVIAGYFTGTIENCSVNNATVIGYNVNDDANGDKVGGIVGCLNEHSYLNGNTVSNSAITGNRDIGGIAGSVAASTYEMKNNKVSDTTITYSTSKDYASAGEIVSGRTGYVADDTNVATNVSIIKSVVASTADELAAALKSTDKYINVTLANDIDVPITSLGQQTGGSGEYKLAGEETETITLDLNGQKLNITTTYWSNIGAKNDDAVFTIKNGTMTSSQATGTWNSYDLTFSNCNYVIEDVVFEKAIAFANTGKSAKLSNVTVNETHDYYAIWICAAGMDVEIDGLTVNSAGRGIKIDEEYVGSPAKVTLKVANADFNTAKKAAIMVKSTAGADITLSNVNIADTIDTVHAVWVDEDSAAYVDRVTVTGGEKIYEGNVVSTATELAEAVTAGKTEIWLLPGEYDVAGCGGKTLTISGTKDAVIKLYNDGEDGCDYAFGSAGTGVGSYTFNGITIDTTSNTGNYKGFAYMKGTFNDCNFVGSYSLNNANDFVFNRCTFDFKNGYFWTWAANSVTFDGCTFNGNSKTILAHGGASTVININNCAFVATEKGYTGSGDNTAVVEIDPTGANTYTINFTGENTITDSYAGWTRVKDDSTGHTITGVN
ncbi:MAG: hypothetical protein IJX80_09390 [Clostridia bacterium]|nr:hypothetical protein [Clostridia bacterium]